MHGAKTVWDKPGVQARISTHPVQDGAGTGAGRQRGDRRMWASGFRVSGVVCPCQMVPVGAGFLVLSGPHRLCSILGGPGCFNVT